MLIKELKQKIQDIQKSIPYDIFLDKRSVGWSLAFGGETTELFKIFREHKRKRVYFVTNLDHPTNSGFLAKLKEINRINFGKLFKWANESSEDDNYEVYLAFKYTFKYQDVYDYGLAKNDIVFDYQKNGTSRLVLETKDKTLTKIKVRGLDESLRKIMESLEKTND